MQLQIKRSENQDMSGCTLKKKAYVFHMITSECLKRNIIRGSEDYTVQYSINIFL